MKIAIVLPMYNEETNVPLLLAAIAKVRKEKNLDLEAIAVNDGSKDSTLKVLKGLGKKYPFLFVVDHGKNRGVAQALKTGIETALKRKDEVFFFMDSDLTHNPEDFPKFIKKIEDGYDLVIGSRFIKGGGMVGVPTIRVLISQIGNLFGRVVLGVPVRDFTSGFRCLRAEVFKKVKLEEDSFPIQLEETVKTYASGFKVGEVPIILTTRKYGQSSMVYNFRLFKNYFNLLSKCFVWLKNGS